MIIVCVLAVIYQAYILIADETTLLSGLFNVGFYIFVAYAFFYKSYKRLIDKEKND